MPERIVSKFPPAPAPNAIPDHSPNRNGAMLDMLPGCLFNYIYVWKNPPLSFWMYPVEVAGGYISGFVWNGLSWDFIRFDYNEIMDFY